MSSNTEDDCKLLFTNLAATVEHDERWWLEVRYRDVGGCCITYRKTYEQFQRFYEVNEHTIVDRLERSVDEETLDSIFRDFVVFRKDLLEELKQDAILQEKREGEYRAKLRADKRAKEEARRAALTAYERAKEDRKIARKEFEENISLVVCFVLIFWGLYAYFT